MNILQVCAFGAPKPGNFVAALLALQKKLEKEGHHTIYVFVERARSQEWCQELEKRNKVYYIPEERARINRNVYKMFRQIYKENSIDVMHSHFELFDIPATVTAPGNVRIYWHLHDAMKELYDRGSRSRKLLTRLQYGLFGRRAKLLSVSEAHAGFIAELGFKKEAIYYLPNGIDCSRIQPHTGEERDFYLMFGWEVARKGVDVAVDAMKTLETMKALENRKVLDKMIREKGDISLLVVGQEQCKAYLETRSAAGVHFSDPVSDVNELYRRARGFLHISRAEGLSYALLEVIYAGLPVICSDIPENAFARRFKMVHFVPVGDSEAVAKELKRLNALEPNTEAIAYNRKIIEAEYSLNAWCNTMEQFYNNKNEGMEKWKIQF